LFDKLEEIEKTKENVKLLQENNILIDLENGEDIKPNYLMQVFSQPLFERDTFFIEIIQRCGAKGFGAGNITALWKALELHLASSN
jgi:4-hydroxyphenylpyruvate dioxygenase-like putative hemolysin